jgi:hypothetical protein
VLGYSRPDLSKLDFSDGRFRQHRKSLVERLSNEGHGFSRAVKTAGLTALAAEVRLFLPRPGVFCSLFGRLVMIPHKELSLKLCMAGADAPPFLHPYLPLFRHTNQ